MPQNKFDRTKSGAFLKLLLYFGFFLIGIATVLIGQILPILTARMSLSDSAAGRFFVAQFAGSLLGTVLANRFVRRAGYPAVLLIGFALAAVGVFLLNTNSLLVCLGAFFTLGGGIGLTIPSINLLTVRLNPNKTTSALNAINFFWGFGAILCKPLVDFFRTIQTDALSPVTFTVAAPLLLVGAAIGLASVESETAETKIGAVSAASFPPVWTTATAWLIAAFNFLHVGLETGIGGWITTYAARFPAENQSSFGWLSAASAFFLFLVAGRAAAPLLLRFLSDDALLLCGLLTLFVGIVLLLAAEDLRLLRAGAAIAGFGSSAIFPTNTSRFVKIFGAENAARRSTPLFVAGSLGGALVGYSIGFVSAQFNNLRFGMFVLLGGCAALILLQIVLSKTVKTPVDRAN